MLGYRSLDTLPRRIRIRSIRTALPIIALAAVLLAPGARAHAQQSFAIELRSRGAPAVGVEVLFRIEGEDWTLGRTDAAGRIQLVTALFNLGPGARITVYEAPAPDGRGAVLVPPGEPYQAICAAEPRCREVGVFAWGDDAVVDLVSGDVEVVREAPRTDPQRPTPFPTDEFAADDALPRVRVGVGGGYGVWPNLEMACEREDSPPAATCDVTDSRPLFQGVIEYLPDPRFGLGLEVGYTPGLRMEQTFAPTGDPLDPIGHAVDLDVLTVGAYGSTGVRIAPEARLFAALGFLWALNQGDAVTQFQTPERLARDERSEGGGRLAGRAGIDWWAPGQRWGFRVEAGGMSGQSDDLDLQWMGAAKVLISLEPR